MYRDITWMFNAPKEAIEKMVRWKQECEEYALQQAIIGFETIAEELGDRADDELKLVIRFLKAYDPVKHDCFPSHYIEFRIFSVFWENGYRFAYEMLKDFAEGLQEEDLKVEEVIRKEVLGIS